MSVDTHSTEANHPTPKTYAAIALILTIITLVEVWVFYLEVLQSMLVPILTVLSTVKFALVVMFYMHLKFDHGVFTRMLLTGVLLAIAVFLGLLALFTYSHPLIRI